MILRTLIFLHRWVGVALAVLFLLWFLSGIGMMYWGFPEVSAVDLLDHSPRLDPPKIKLSPMEAATSVGLVASPDQIRLNSFDGRPVYRIAAGGFGPDRIVYADTGEEQTEVSGALRDRIAAAWTGQAAAAARIESVEQPDQWTVKGKGRVIRVRPLYKYSWPNGEQVYIAGTTGEVVQYTTRESRIKAHLSAIPHWLYYTPLRIDQQRWLRFMKWISGIGAFGVILGLVIGVWRYSPSKKYLLAGKPTGIPYRGQERWHAILGLLSGVATLTWVFSGMLSLGFSSLEPDDGVWQTAPVIDAALRGPVGMTDFDGLHPRDLVAKNPGLDIREIDFTSFAGTPVVAANLAAGRTQMLSIDGVPIPEFDRDKIVEIVKGAAADPKAVETRIIDQYDLYYRDRTRQQPLPVILALMNDPIATRYYIDPKTARVVGGYSSPDWVSRWLHHGLHSLDFPWLYNYRPLWDIVVITFMLGGTALCVTSLVLAWRVLGRTLRRAAKPPSDALTAEA